MTGALTAYAAALLAIAGGTVAIAGLAHWTALIPAILGGLVLLVALGLRQRWLGRGLGLGLALMLAATALAGTLSALPRLPAALEGDLANPEAVIARTLTALATLLVLPVLILRRRSGG